MRTTLVVALLVLAIDLPRVLFGQEAPAARECGETSTIPFARVAMRRLCRLADAPEVRIATGATDAMSLLGKAPPDVLWRISDRELLDFVAAFAQSLGSVPDSTCADIYPRPGAAPWAQRFMGVAQAIDSTMSERWADLLEAWVWSTVRHSPLRPQASPAQAVAHVRKQFADITAAERADMIRLVQHKAIAAPAACHIVRLSFARYTQGAPADAAAALRALMNGVAPWFVAT